MLYLTHSLCDVAVCCCVQSLGHVRLCDPMNWSPSGDPRARTLGWAARPASRGSSQPGAQPLISQVPTWQVGSLPAEPPEGHTPFTEKNKRPKITLVQNDTAIMGWQRRLRPCYAGNAVSVRGSRSWLQPGLSWGTLKSAHAWLPRPRHSGGIGLGGFWDFPKLPL